MPSSTSFVRRLAATVVALIAIAGSPASAQWIERNILTGGPTGTYIQFGRDIADVASQCGIVLNVQESAGSLENFLGVRQRRHTQFGIVQSDVLEFLQTYASDDPDVARAIAGVRIAFPLYNEEVHLLARSDIEDVSGLAGKRVAVGVEDSGTFLTASLLLDLLAIDVEPVTVGPDEALQRLLDGDVDALFYVAGAPTALFQNPDIPADGFHLLPLTDPVLQAVYLPTTIPADTYAFQAEPVEAVAVKAVLMTYDYDRNRNAYHRESCDAVAEISHLILTRFPELQANGHPKWSQVDLNDIPPGWEVGACVNEGLRANFRMSCSGGGEEAEAVEDGSAANSVYRDRICATIGC